MSRHCYALVNEAWTATSGECPSGLNITQGIQKKRWIIIAADADHILPEHICTAVWRPIRRPWRILLLSKLNSADTKCGNVHLKMWTFQQPSASLEDSDMEESRLLITHTLTHTHSKSHLLQSPWVMVGFSAAPALFHTPCDRTQLFLRASALCLFPIDPSSSESPSFALPSTERGTYSTRALTPHSISLLFGCHLASSSPFSSQLLSTFHSPRRRLPCPDKSQNTSLRCALALLAGLSQRERAREIARFPKLPPK